MNEKHFAINRVQKLRTHGRGAKTLSQSLRHLDKHKQASDIVHPELSHLNRSFLSDEKKKPFKEIAKRLDKLRDYYNKKVDEWNEKGGTPSKRHMQARAAQVFEGVLTFSPEMKDKINLNEWVKVNLSFIQNEFIKKGCSALRIELHMDEETPHLHFILAVNGKDEKYLAKDILGGRSDLSKLQNRYAEQMEEFGLERGHSRYNEYMNLERRAISQGYGNKDGSITYEQVKQFADANGLNVPKKRKHRGIKEWKAEQQNDLMKAEQHLETVEQRLETVKQLLKEQGELLPENYLDLLGRCQSYEDLLSLADKIIIGDEGQEKSLLEYLLEVQEAQLEKQRSNDFER